jgi:quinolinate synthase
MTLNSRKMPLRPGQPAPRPSVPASTSPRRIRQQYQKWPRAHLMVHPANEGNIWNDSDAIVAKHVTSDQQSEKPHSTCRMHHLMFKMT